MAKGLYRNRKYTIGDKIVVMSFPGTGKTEAASKYPDIFIDVSASDYYLGGLPIPEYTDIGEFPSNYVNKIEEILEDSSIKASIVLISNHIEVAQELKNRNIKFCTISSTHSITMQGIMRARYCKHLVEYFSDTYNDHVHALEQLCDGSILGSGCKKIESVFLGHRDPSVTYRHIINQFNRRIKNG